MSQLRAYLACATSGLPQHADAAPVRVAVSVVASGQYETAHWTADICPDRIDTRAARDAEEHHGIPIQTIWAGVSPWEAVQRLSQFLLLHGQPALVTWNRAFARTMMGRMGLDYPYWTDWDVQGKVRAELQCGKPPTMEFALTTRGLPPRVRGDVLRDARLTAALVGGGGGA